MIVASIRIETARPTPIASADVAPALGSEPPGLAPAADARAGALGGRVHVRDADELRRAGGRAARRPSARARRSPASPPTSPASGTRSESQAVIASASGAWRRLGELLPASPSATIFATVSAASFLFVPMTPDGPRLIQPERRTRRGAGGAVLLAHAPALVADQAAPLVERDVVDRLAAVADRAQDDAALDLLLLAGGRRRAARRSRPARCGCARRRMPLTGPSSPATEDRDRRAQELQRHAVWLLPLGGCAARSRLRISTLLLRGRARLLGQPLSRCARRAPARRGRRSRRRV